MELLTSEQMRAADRAAIVDMKIPGLKLMENAGGEVAEVVDRMLRKNSPRPEGERVRVRGHRIFRIGIVCGKGNNGGDGLVVARMMARKGYKIGVYLLSEALSEDAAVQLKRLPKIVSVHRIHSSLHWKKQKTELLQSDIIIDAIFGTGLSKPLTGFVRKIVGEINEMDKPVIAVDIPSGIDATTGRVLGVAIRARLTVTFARPKIGHILYPGAACTGELKIADIGIPERAVAAARPDTFLIDRRIASKLLPPRPDHSHKGTFGRSLILAGSRGMAGAAVLAAEAAMRIGSGLTQLCVPESIYTIAARKLSPEALCATVPDARRGFFGPESLKPIVPLMERATCVLLGPGIGRHPKTIRWVTAILKSVRSDQKLILDADALYALAESRCPWPAADIAITPHAGEMAKLTGRTRGFVESNPCAVAREVSKKYRLTVVLKGSRSMIAEPAGRLDINSTGNAALAKGATGDVLAGMICGLAAQGLSTFDAARLAVYLHGRAADIAVGAGRDKRTFLAADIFQYLDPALRELSS